MCVILYYVSVCKRGSLEAIQGDSLSFLLCMHGLSLKLHNGGSGGYYYSISVTLHFLCMISIPGHKKPGCPVQTTLDRACLVQVMTIMNISCGVLNGIVCVWVCVCVGGGLILIK